MAKLLAGIDVQFKTTALLVHDEESSRETALDGGKGKEFFDRVPPAELTFEVVSTNEDAGASFPFFLKSGKKGAIFDVQMVDDGRSLAVRILGEFSVTLRSGCTEMLQGIGNKLDLRIRGVMWKGGAYNGFMAGVYGGDFKQESANWPATFPKVSKFSIK